MATPRKLIHVWFAGYFERYADIGIGWAVRNDKEGFDTQQRRIPFDVGDYHEFGPDCADLVACAHALKSLPDKAAVVMHTGSPSLIRWMEEGRAAFEMRQHQKWLSVPPFRQAFEEALAQERRMLNVAYDYVRKNNEGIEIANNLAESAVPVDED